MLLFGLKCFCVESLEDLARPCLELDLLIGILRGFTQPPGGVGLFRYRSGVASIGIRVKIIVVKFVSDAVSAWLQNETFRSIWTFRFPIWKFVSENRNIIYIY
eukprot:TRINITY_DN6053_c0_g1_i1.p1 TRINITY_DN6053_c0_g1~~TRINITY_DN6053_c0_g1_i1.p1  ORF type:complete len:103 (+),score=7.98 TRINITY_DN6053_c0_g1_i1:1458-1766(+)